jgi:hypothetical protein
MDIQERKSRELPLDFDIIADTVAHDGDWYGLAVFGAVFPNLEDANRVDGTGKNLSALNDLLPDGFELMGRFTRITLSGGVALAYKG